jgi:hypothetical protein
MAFHDIIVIGGSAGGVEVLMELARGLPSGLPTAVSPWASRRSRARCFS